MTNRIDTTKEQDNLDICPACIGTGYYNHPDSGEVCSICEGTGGVYSGKRAKSLIDALVAKESEIERLREALMFYADNENWNDAKLENDQPYTLTLVPSSAMSDCGRVARAALKGADQ